MAERLLTDAERAVLGRFYGAGDFAALEREAMRLIESYPGDGFLWQVLGVARGALGKEALPALERAAALLPDDADAYSNLGNALQAIGRTRESELAYRRAIELCPANAIAHYNLGTALQQRGQCAAAEAAYRQAIALDPGFAAAHFNLGTMLDELGQIAAAEASYAVALRLLPRHAQAAYNLGLIRQNSGRLREAEVFYRRVLAVDASHAEATNNLAIVLNDLGLLPEAEAYARRALVLQPGFVEAFNNLGVILAGQNRLDEAEACYRQALALRPTFAEAHTQLLFLHNYTSRYSPGYRLEEARAFGRAMASLVQAKFTEWRCRRSPERLRVGFVSGDLRDHPVGHFLEGVLAELDCKRIEAIAYPSSRETSALTERIRPFFAAWTPIVGLDDATVAARIHADGVHILVDLAGHTRYNRLPVFAWKPAPVQVSWLGYFATTGLVEIDYLLADRTGVPEAHRGDFCETVFYLPDTRLCFTPPADGAVVAALPALSTGCVTFGCFQHLSKLTDEMLVLWAEILGRLPGARLYIQNLQIGDERPEASASLRQRLMRCGLPLDRVTMQGAVERDRYLDSYARVDIVLDTFPYPGGTTTCEALWMGVPTVTLAGGSLLERQGVSLLSAAGFPQWVAETHEDYVATALSLAADLAALARLRAGLREAVRRSPLFDAPSFARAFEDALHDIWRAHESGGYPRAISR